MDPNALYAALNTLAQCAAALAALIGFLGLWRLDRLRAEREQAERDLRGLLHSPSRSGIELMIWPTARILQEARKLAAIAPEKLYLNDEKTSQPRVQEILGRWGSLSDEQRRLMSALQQFLRRTLVILALAIGGLVVADALHAWVVTRWVTGLLILVAAYRLWRDTAAVVREAAGAIRGLVIAALLLTLTTPAGAGSVHCTTYEEKTLGRWESTVAPPPGQTCTGRLNPKTRPWEGRCR